MEDQLEKPEEKDTQKLQEEFLNMVESKIKREEKDVWFIKNENHLENLRKI
jgi:hypothetical protein